MPIKIDVFLKKHLCQNIRQKKRPPKPTTINRFEAKHIFDRIWLENSGYLRHGSTRNRLNLGHFRPQLDFR